MRRRQRPDRRAGLETTELQTLRDDDRRVPPPPEAVGAGAYPAVLSGATSAIVGALMALVGVLVLVDAVHLPTSSDPLGPAAFPYVIGSLLTIVGTTLAVINHRYAFVLLRVRRGGWMRRGNSVRALLVLVAILAFAALLPLVGFFVASAALYVGVAVLLGAPRGWHLVFAGVLISGSVVLLFDRIVGLSLPAGPWGF